MDKQRLISQFELIEFTLNFLNSKEIEKNDYLYAYNIHLNRFYQGNFIYLLNENNELHYFKKEYLKKIFKLLADFKYLNERKITEITKTLISKDIIERTYNENIIKKALGKILRFLIRGKLKKALKNIILESS